MKTEKTENTEKTEKLKTQRILELKQIKGYNTNFSEWWNLNKKEMELI